MCIKEINYKINIKSSDRLYLSNINVTGIKALSFRFEQKSD